MLWGVSLDLAGLGLSYAFSFDVTGGWFMYAAIPGIAAALLATVEARRPLQTIGFSVVAVAFIYVVNWLLARVFTAPFQ